MTATLTVRPLQRGDLPHLHPILDGTGLFPPDLLADMAEPFLAGGSEHRWLVALDGEARLGFAYCEPERMTEGTFNLLAIAVAPERQGAGVGRQLVAALEAALRADGGRVLLVETSSLDAYERTRAFYDREGFTREAQVRDFYQDGEDKILFWKRL